MDEFLEDDFVAVMLLDALFLVVVVVVVVVVWGELSAGVWGAACFAGES